MNILGFYISESLETIFWVKMLTFFHADAEPGSGHLLTLDPGSGMEKIRIPAKHPRSATRLITDQKRFVDVSLYVYRIF
jgi:hypothetical protein